MKNLVRGGKKTLPEAEFSDEIQTKVLGVFLLDIHRHLYSFSLRFLSFKFTQLLTVSKVELLYTVNEKGGKPIENYTPFPMV